MDIFLFIVLGIVSGLLGGLLGVGGGVITVPALYYLLNHTHLYQGEQMQVAIATSLAIGCLISAASSAMQLKKKAIHFTAFFWMLPALVIGCFMGAYSSKKIESDHLLLIFAFASLLLGLYFLFPSLPSPSFAKSPNPSLLLFGLGIGFLSTLLGIGGGAIAFPILLGYGLPSKNASATSSSSTFITTFSGSLAYLFVGDRLLSYIFLPAFFITGLAAFLFSFLGVLLSHYLHVNHIKRIFGLFLILIFLSIIY